MEKFNFYSKYIYRIKFKKGMLAKGELGPSNKPAPTYPKYERLGLIRNNPLGLRMTHVETGEVIEYRSTYEAKKKTGHSWIYFEKRNGKVDNGYKFEIFHK